MWYKKFDGFMKKNGYRKCNADNCCYFRRIGKSFIILLLYIDDMLVASINFDEFNKLKRQLLSRFKMMDLG